MKNKKTFRIRRSAKLNALTANNPLLQQMLQKIVGGNTNSVKGKYSRLMGVVQQ